VTARFPTAWRRSAVVIFSTMASGSSPALALARRASTARVLSIGSETGSGVLFSQSGFRRETR